MFVVVYLIEPKINIVIPEEWIFALDEEKIKNMGANSNQSYRIFYSNDASNENGVPNGLHAPNFNLLLMDIFPPSYDVVECCYIGRVKHFYREYIQ